MEDIYYINLEDYTLDKFEDKLTSRELLPGRRLLLEDIQNRFQILRAMGISSVKQLLDLLKNKTKIEQVAIHTGIPTNYLTVLRREAGSFLPTLVPLEKIVEPENAQYIISLNEIGIKNSKQLFEVAYLINKRAEISTKLSIPMAALTKWVKLCDLLRINGVGPAFAFLLYEAGITSLEQFASESPEQLKERVNLFNSEQEFTNVKLSLKDMEYCIYYVKELDVVLEL